MKMKLDKKRIGVFLLMFSAIVLFFTLPTKHADLIGCVRQSYVTKDSPNFIGYPDNFLVIVGIQDKNCKFLEDEALNHYDCEYYDGKIRINAGEYSKGLFSYNAVCKSSDDTLFFRFLE